MLVSENNDYARQRAGELKPAMIINSPYYFGGVPQGTNVSVLEVKSMSFIQAFSFRWLKTVFSSYILMGHFYHSLSLDATIMVSNNCQIIEEHFFYQFRESIGYHSNSMTC